MNIMCVCIWICITKFSSACCCTCSCSISTVITHEQVEIALFVYTLQTAASAVNLTNYWYASGVAPFYHYTIWLLSIMATAAMRYCLLMRSFSWYSNLLVGLNALHGGESGLYEDPLKYMCYCMVKSTRWRVMWFKNDCMNSFFVWYLNCE